ncbi:MAG TPA: hypothetical protein VGS16_07315 [Candidatus Dormibacteraeota bacterium]|nr:hypothetical protein [Candidatus Dormibacteraeota bacterium]
MRGFLIGLIFLVGLSVTVLSLRPGGFRRQLRFVARRFRITLVLGGIFFIGSLIIRVAFPNGVVADYGPPALAIVLAVAFMVLGRDPAPEPSPPARLP